MAPAGGSVTAVAMLLLTHDLLMPAVRGRPTGYQLLVGRHYSTLYLLTHVMRRHRHASLVSLTRSLTLLPPPLFCDGSVLTADGFSAHLSVIFVPKFQMQFFQGLRNL